MLDNEQAEVNIDPSPAADEASAVATPSQDTGNDAPTGSGDTGTPAPANAGTQPQTDERSLTSQTGPQDADKSQAQMDWEKRYHEQAKGLGKLQSEVGRLRQYERETRQNYDGIDPNAVRAWREQQEKAKQAQLPQWHAKHPEAPRFKQQYSEYSRLVGLWNRAKTEEAKNEIASEIEQFPSDLRNKFSEFNNHRKMTVERIAEEMTGYNSLEEMIAEKAASVVAEQQARHEAASRVNTWFDDPSNQPIVEQTREAMAEALQAGVPLPYVQAMAKMHHELDVLKSRLSNSGQTAQQSQARTQAAKANAAITRDVPVGARRADPVAIAKERGIETNSTAYANLLQELVSKNLL